MADYFKSIALRTVLGICGMLFDLFFVKKLGILFSPLFVAIPYFYSYIFEDSFYMRGFLTQGEKLFHGGGFVIVFLVLNILYLFG